MVDKCPNCGSEFFYNTAGQYCSVCGYTKPYRMSYSNTTTAAIDNNINRVEYTMPNLPFYSKYVTDNPQTLNIDCSKITLHHKSLDIDIDISTNIASFDEITVNGIKFKKEV